MKTTYLKCHHGTDKRSMCAQCEKEQSEMKNIFNQYATEKKEDKIIPIYRGCSSIGGCFCTGRCREIIGYHE